MTNPALFFFFFNFPFVFLFVSMCLWCCRFGRGKRGGGGGGCRVITRTREIDKETERAWSAEERQCVFCLGASQHWCFRGEEEEGQDWLYSHHSNGYCIHQMELLLQWVAFLFFSFFFSFLSLTLQHGVGEESGSFRESSKACESTIGGKGGGVRMGSNRFSQHGTRIEYRRGLLRRQKRSTKHISTVFHIHTQEWKRKKLGPACIVHLYCCKLAPFPPLSLHSKPAPTLSSSLMNVFVSPVSHIWLSSFVVSCWFFSIPPMPPRQARLSRTKLKFHCMQARCKYLYHALNILVNGRCSGREYSDCHECSLPTALPILALPHTILMFEVAQQPSLPIPCLTTLFPLLFLCVC